MARGLGNRVLDCSSHRRFSRCTVTLCPCCILLLLITVAIITSGQSNLTQGRIALVHLAHLSPETNGHLEPFLHSSRQIVFGHDRACSTVPDRQTDRQTDRLTDRQTDRQTDHTTRSVTIGRIYIHSTAMQPNNNNKWSK